MNRLSQLSVRDWYLLAISMLLVPMTAGLLRLVGFHKTKLFLTWLIPYQDKHIVEKIEQINVGKHVARVVSLAASRGLYHGNCLKKSLVVWRLLESRGIHSELKIGVRKDNSDLQAHAWVELDGIILAGHENTATFKPFDSITNLPRAD